MLEEEIDGANCLFHWETIQADSTEAPRNSPVSAFDISIHSKKRQHLVVIRPKDGFGEDFSFVSTPTGLIVCPITSEGHAVCLSRRCAGSPRVRERELRRLAHVLLNFSAGPEGQRAGARMRASHVPCCKSAAATVHCSSSGRPSALCHRFP